MHLSPCSSDEFSVKGDSNGTRKSSLNFRFETLDAPDFVLDMIRRGYRLPLAEYPTQCFLKNNRSALQHPEFLAEAISELLSNGCIVEHEVPPFCVNPLMNAQLPRFNSKFASPGCSGVDALAQDWQDENNWICPPVSAIVPSIRALSSCSGYCTLIVPQWPSAYFWPFLRDRPSQFKSFVKEVLELPCIEDLLLEGPGQKQIYKARSSAFSGCLKFKMLALRVDFRSALSCSFVFRQVAYLGT